MRRLLPIVVPAVLAAAASLPGQDSRPGGEAAGALARFVERHRKQDGAYGPLPSGRSTLPWTRYAVTCLQHIGRRPPDAGSLARWLAGFERTGPDPDARHLEWLQSWEGLGREPKGEPGPVPELVTTLPPLTTWLGSVPLSVLETAARLRARLGREPAAKDQVLWYLALWRGRDGGYGYPASLDEVFPLVAKGAGLRKLPEPADLPSSAGATAAAVSTFKTLGCEVPGAGAVAAFLESLQEDEGAFRMRSGTWGDADLWSTWNAVRALRLLGRQVPHKKHTVAWIRKHQRRSGGFAHAGGEPESLEATWLALECLELLDAPLPDPADAPEGDPLPPARGSGDPALHQAVFEMGPDPGVCAMLAPRIGAGLVLMKGDDEPDLARRVRRIADAQGLSLAAACAREEHRRAWGMEGLGYVSHCSDVVFAPGTEIGDRGRYRSFADLDAAWEPARKAGALVASCAYGVRELLAPAYNLSTGPGGYDLLMAAWAMSPRGDLLRHVPWLQRYVGRLPVFGNHDAHGDPFHWLAKGLRARTLFFAESGDLAGFREAVRANRVVAVAHRGTYLALHGHPVWVERARSLRKVWDRGRPETEAHWVPDPVVVAVDHASSAELPFLRSGYALLVRAAHGPADDAFPGEVSCKVDGRSVALRLVPPALEGRPALWAPLPDLEAGRHQVVVEACGRRTEVSLRFTGPVGPKSPRSPHPYPRVPASLDFDELEDVAFVRGPLGTSAPDGAMAVSCSRQDFVLQPAEPGVHRLELVHRAPDHPLPARVFVNGVPCGEVHLGAEGRRQRALLDVPEDALREGPNWVSLRTDLPFWLLSFPVPKASAWIERVALVPAGSGR